MEVLSGQGYFFWGGGEKESVDTYFQVIYKLISVYADYSGLLLSMQFREFGQASDLII